MSNTIIKKNILIIFLESIFSLFSKVSGEGIVYLFLFCLPVLEFQKDQPEINLIKHLIYRAITLLLIFYTITHYLNTNQRRVIHRNIYAKSPLFIYFLTAVISVLVAVLAGIMETGKGLFSVVTIPLLFSLIVIIPYWIDDKDKLIRCVKYFEYSIIYSLLLGILDFFIPAKGHTDIRVSSFFSDPNMYSRFLCIGTFFLILQFYYKKFWLFSKRKTYILLIAILVELIFTLSRSGYTVLFLGALFIVFNIKNTKAKTLLAVFIILLAIGASIFIFYQRFNTQSMVEDSSLNRVLLIIGGLNFIKHNWLIGIGYTNFQYYFSANFVEPNLHVSLYKWDNLGYTSSIHNWFVEVFSEQGIFGLLGFMSIFYVYIFKLRNLRKRLQSSTLKFLVHGFLLMIFTFLFQGFFYHTFISQFFFWVLFGVLNAAINVSYKELNGQNA